LPTSESSGASLNLTLIWIAEPKIHVIRSPARLVFLDAADDQGRPIELNEQRFVQQSPYMPVVSETVGMAPLNVDPRAIRIARFRAQGMFVLRGEAQTISVPDISVGASGIIVGDGALEVSVEPPVKQPNNQTTFTVKYQCRKMSDSQWASLAPNLSSLRVSITGASGGIASGITTNLNGPADVSRGLATVTYIVPVIPQKASNYDHAAVSIEVSLGVNQITVPVEFTDIPIP
jgi:hypothetical protein